jgi:hypothetical protein
MHRRHLYKYYSSRRYAEQFLDGKLLFRSLAYFRDYEDKSVRGDRHEGTSVYRPKDGLIVNNITQGMTFTLPGHAFESSVKAEEIWIFCLAQVMTDKLREEFGASCCVEIVDIPTFCARITAALPAGATFPDAQGRTRIGHRVVYYTETAAGNPRWALPDRIAVSKLQSYAWQTEFRLVFSLSGALAFENVDLQLTQVEPGRAKAVDHKPHLVMAPALRDLCRLHLF